jgi:hypothetical protein
MENSDSGYDSQLNYQLFSESFFDLQNKVFYILVFTIISIIITIYYRNPDFLGGTDRYMNIISEKMDIYKNKVLLYLNMSNGAVKSYSTL